MTYAGFWVRVGAFILDGIVLGLFSGAVASLYGPSFYFSTNGGFHFGYNYAYSAINTLVGLVYFIGSWSYLGRTPGMIPLRLYVVRAEDGSRIDLGRAIIRYVGLIISLVVVFLGVIWVGLDSRKQGWHDKMAGTAVIQVER